MALEQTVLDDIAEKIAGGLRLLGGVKDGAQAQVKAIVENALGGVRAIMSGWRQTASTCSSPANRASGIRNCAGKRASAWSPPDITTPKSSGWKNWRKLFGVNSMWKLSLWMCRTTFEAG